MQFRHILVRATNWVGDAVMSLPALQALRLHQPAARISVLARPAVADLYAREAFCDELIPYNAQRGWRGWQDQWMAARELRARHFDAALLLQNAFEAAALAWLARIPNRIGYDRDGRGFLLTRRVAVPTRGEIPAHQRFYYLELLRRSGLIPKEAVVNETVQMHDPASAARTGKEMLRASGLPQPVIGVAPGAAYGGAKRWLPERFAEAAVQVARARNGSVAVFGARNEVPICAQVEREAAAASITSRNLAGKTTLRQLIDCLAACDVVLTNDSGAMHLAAALGVPTVAVFGATDDAATGPIGNRARVIRHPVECSPCLLRECPIDHRCMTGVSAQLVATEALRLTTSVVSQVVYPGER